VAVIGQEDVAYFVGNQAAQHLTKSFPTWILGEFPGAAVIDPNDGSSRQRLPARGIRFEKLSRHFFRDQVHADFRRGKPVPGWITPVDWNGCC